MRVRFFFKLSCWQAHPPQEAEEGGESVGEASDPLHNFGHDDLVTVRARQLHRILAQELNGDDEAAASAAVKAAAAATANVSRI